MQLNQILIVAGMPCSGKSSLLQHAVQDSDQPLSKLYAHLKEAAIPSPIEELQLPLEEKIKRRYWLNEINLINAKVNNIELHNQIIHFDIYTFYMAAVFNYLRISPASLTIEDVVKIKRMTDKKENILTALGFLKPLLPQKSEITVKLIEADYELVCRRWTERVQQQGGQYTLTQKILHDFIYCHSIEGKRLYLDFVELFRTSLSDPALDRQIQLHLL